MYHQWIFLSVASLIKISLIRSYTMLFILHGYGPMEPKCCDPVSMDGRILCIQHGFSFCLRVWLKLHYLNRSRGDLYCMAMGAWDPHVMAHFEWMDALCVSSVDFPLVSEFDLNFPYLDNKKWKWWLSLHGHWCMEPKNDVAHFDWIDAFCVLNMDFLLFASSIKLPLFIS